MTASMLTTGGLALVAVAAAAVVVCLVIEKAIDRGAKGRVRHLAAQHRRSRRRGRRDRQHD